MEKREYIFLENRKNWNIFGNIDKYFLWLDSFLRLESPLKTCCTISFFTIISNVELRLKLSDKTSRNWISSFDLNEFEVWQNGEEESWRLFKGSLQRGGFDLYTRKISYRSKKHLNFYNLYFTRERNKLKRVFFFQLQNEIKLINQIDHYEVVTVSEIDHLSSRSRRLPFAVHSARSRNRSWKRTRTSEDFRMLSFWSVSEETDELPIRVASRWTGREF